MAKGGLGQIVGMAADVVCPMVGSGWATDLAIPEQLYADHLEPAARIGRTGQSAQPAQWPTPTCRPRQAAASNAAESFVAWLKEHGLAREWTVDEVWYLAENDFAEALGLKLPPRRVFLGTLKKASGVRVTQNRRIRDRDGKATRKTTFYDFAVF